jgi:hypothetical protein
VSVRVCMRVRVCVCVCWCVSFFEQRRRPFVCLCPAPPCRRSVSCCVAVVLRVQRQRCVHPLPLWPWGGIRARSSGAPSLASLHVDCGDMCKPSYQACPNLGKPRVSSVRRRLDGGRVHGVADDILARRAPLSGGICHGGGPQGHHCGTRHHAPRSLSKASLGAHR